LRRLSQVSGGRRGWFDAGRWFDGWNERREWGPGRRTAPDSETVEQAAALIGRDQTLADFDQTASDTDQTASETDQTASDNDQAASDRDLVHGGDPGQHELTRGLRDRSTQRRQQDAGQRHQAAAARDEAAQERDLAASAYYDAATILDHEREARSAPAPAPRRRADGVPIAARALESRARAAADREVAAKDRARAAADRERAARDRSEAAADRDALLAQLAATQANHRAERAQSQDALRMSEERYRLLAENSSDVIMLVSSAGTVGYVSSSARSVFGYEPEEMVGRDYSWGVHPEDRAAVDDVVAAFMAGSKQAMTTYEYRARRQDGRYVWVEANTSRLSSPVPGGGDEFQSAIRDISDRKRAEEEVKRARDEAELANRARSEFLSSMSHELRTPLNAVLGFTGTLLMGVGGPLTEGQITQLRTVQRAGKHLLSSINGLLDLAHIESGRAALHLESVDCRKLVDHVVAELRPLAADRGLEFEARSGSQPIELICDRHAVTRILVNLTDNAIKFTDEGGVGLELSQRFDDEDRSVTRFAVIDTGCGLASPLQQQFATAFDRGGRADTSLLRGSGLGLYVAQSLADSIGGKLSLESKPGEGSTFVLEMMEPAT
jgi:PAS domain S-box-containing protein